MGLGARGHLMGEGALGLTRPLGQSDTRRLSHFLACDLDK